MSKPSHVDRREFFRRIGQAGAGAAIAGLAVALTVRDRGKAGVNRSEHVCRGNGVCDGCGSLAQCKLPQAMATRRDSRKR